MSYHICTLPSSSTTEVADGRSRSVREAEVLDSDSDSDESGPVYGGRSDDEGNQSRITFTQ